MSKVRVTGTVHCFLKVQSYLKSWSDNFVYIFFMGTSWIVLLIKNIKTRASREMTSRKNIQFFYFNGVNVGMWRARYLPSLIALFSTAMHILDRNKRVCNRTGVVIPYSYIINLNYLFWTPPQAAWLDYLGIKILPYHFAQPP